MGSERDGSASGTSRLSVLRYDVSGSATSLSATREWNLTADLPAVSANGGIEALTFVPDAALTAAGFRTSTGATYDPASLSGALRRDLPRRHRDRRSGARLRAERGGRLHQAHLLRERPRGGDGPGVGACAGHPVGGLRRHLLGQGSHLQGRPHRSLHRGRGLRPPERDAELQQRGLRDRAAEHLRERPQAGGVGRRRQRRQPRAAHRHGVLLGALNRLAAAASERTVPG
ncbi:hypothetical protein [Nocardioides convexus]|uniref:hypothetical protein n=1 Tax=Nocardioides convexus TaxID=2712224 RepID=UPI002418243F|nr:hypothetical protein [Nocardioides convexus]